MKYTKYREKLMQELEKPYCEEEYKRLFKYMKHKKLVEYHKEHRSGPRTCKRNYLGKSLLNHHVDLNKKLKSVRGDYPKRLTLLRGFVFWLTHCADDEAFKPWIYPEYCKPAPKVTLTVALVEDEIIIHTSNTLQTFRFIALVLFLPLVKGLLDFPYSNLRISHLYLYVS
ncbi:hypothetical protein HN51_066991 [Arachis hypogaea]